jgi:hypothetical protein
MTVKNFNQPLQINLNAADDMIAEVKMTQMHFNKMQNICFKRCMGRMGDSFDGGANSDASSTNSSDTPVVADLSKAENGRVNVL